MIETVDVYNCMLQSKLMHKMQQVIITDYNKDKIN